MFLYPLGRTAWDYKNLFAKIISYEVTFGKEILLYQKINEITFPL